MGFDAVCADADDADASFGEVGVGVAHGAGLFGAAGGVGFGVEEDGDVGGAFVGVGEVDGFAVLVGGFESWGVDWRVDFDALSCMEVGGGEHEGGGDDGGE